LLAKTKGFCFSMRYHGAILAARRNKFVIGATQIKIKDLIEETGIAGEYVSTIEYFRRIMESQNTLQFVSNEEIINRLQRQFDESARQLFAPFAWREQTVECGKTAEGYQL
jgi:polysaccharide pyruvyl transferase WcaK-like protein